MKNACVLAKRLLGNDKTIEVDVSNLMYEFQKRLLNLNISQVIKKHKSLLSLRDDLLQKSVNELGQPNSDVWTNLLKTRRDIQQNKNIRHTNRKLAVLKSVFLQEHGIKFNKKWFVNLTNVDFPLEVKWLLSLGLKFGIPVESSGFPLFEFIADI